MLIRLQNLQLSQAISLNFLSQFPHPQNSRQIHPPTSLLSFCEDKLINIYKLFENKSLCINAKNCLPPTHSQNFCSNCINTPIASLLFSRIYTHLGIKNSFGADISVTKLLTIGNDLIKTHVVLMNCNKYKYYFFYVVRNISLGNPYFIKRLLTQHISILECYHIQTHRDCCACSDSLLCFRRKEENTQQAPTEVSRTDTRLEGEATVRRMLSETVVLLHTGVLAKKFPTLLSSMK